MNHQTNGFKKPVQLVNRNVLVNISLILMDVITISLAVMVSAGIRVLLAPLFGMDIFWPPIITGLYIFVFFNLALAWLNGLYPGFGLAAVHEMQKILYVVSLSSVFLGVFLFLQQLGLAYSRSVFVLTWLLSLLFMMLGRFALRNRFSKFDWWGIPMVIIGSQERVLPVIEKLLQSRRLGFRPVYYYDPQGQAVEPILDVMPVNSQEELQVLVETTRIEHVIFTDPISETHTFNYHWMRDVFPNILFVMNTAPFGSLWVRTVDLHGTLAIETNYHLLNHREMIIKRVIDIVLTVLMLLFAWPVFIILACLVKISSKGPVLYSQKRLGKSEKQFDSYKFRTMHENAEEKLQELLANDPAANREYRKFHKLANDPRVTRIGKFLRRYSLDELPQLINVIKGDMNLIGPRSYLPRELPAMGEYAKVVLKVKPGVTGWWQVMGRNATSFEQRLQLDEYYISNWSVWLDIYIVIKSVWVVLHGQGL